MKLFYQFCAIEFIKEEVRLANYVLLKKYKELVSLLKEVKTSGINKVRVYEVFINWIKNNLSRNQFLIFAGILVGLSSGMAGVLLKLMVHYIHYFITTKFHFEGQIIFYFVFPFLGIFLTTLIVVYLFKGQHRKGIPAILYEIAQNSSIVTPVKMYSQIIQSAVTVGLGGSAGLESPIAVTGAAIGSNFAQTYKLGYKERTLLLAAGATAGIAAAFNAPIAGMMFAFEILLTGVVFSDFIPLAVAAVCGSLLSRIILKEEVLFQFTSRNPFDYHNIFYYIFFAILCGLYARYFLLVSKFVEHQFQRLNLSLIKKAIIAGALLSVLCLLLPPLFGEGYSAVKDLANGNIEKIIGNSFFNKFQGHQWLVILFLMMVCFLKAFATPITIFGGGNGGNFAPALFSGAFLGYLFALICKQAGFENIPVTNLVIVGMAGVMSGVFYAPLTAIFLIAESSSGYDLFIPLMIVAVISFLMAKWFSPISPELKLMAEKGQIFTKEHDRNLLSLLTTADFIDYEYQSVTIYSSFSELITVFKNGSRNTVAVLDNNQLVGIITLEVLKPFMFPDKYQEFEKPFKLMTIPDAVIKFNDTLVTVLKRFDESGSTQLPVIAETGEFVGFILKADVLDKYRKLLKEYS